MHGCSVIMSRHLSLVCRTPSRLKASANRCCLLDKTHGKETERIDLVPYPTFGRAGLIFGPELSQSSIDQPRWATSAGAVIAFRKREGVRGTQEGIGPSDEKAWQHLVSIAESARVRAPLKEEI